MDKGYLLLRNNQQSGPFSIDELLQQQLKPSDMIWVEGKSTAWTYLSELELIPFVKKAEIPVPSQVANVPDEIERKAEELRQRLLATPPKNYFQDRRPEIETFASPYKLDDEIQFVDYRKEKRIKKNTAFAELLLTCFVIGLFMLGIYKGKSFLGARHKVENSVATQLSSGDQHAARKNVEPLNPALPAVDTVKKIDSSLQFQKLKPKLKKEVIDSLNTGTVQTANAATMGQQEKKEEQTVQDPPSASNETVIKKEADTPVKKSAIASVPEIKTVKEPEKQEKKGFLRGLFKKKKDKEE